MSCSQALFSVVPISPAAGGHKHGIRLHDFGSNRNWKRHFDKYDAIIVQEAKQSFKETATISGSNKSVTCTVKSGDCL